MPGIVYILNNPAMPGLIKIGKTTRCPMDRAAELFTTGVPAPFEVAFAAWVRDPDEVEVRMHEDFERERYGTNREFFQVSVKQATELLLHYAMEGTGYCPALEDCHVDAPDVYRYAEITGLHVYEMASALSRFLSTEAVKAAAAKWLQSSGQSARSEESRRSVNAGQTSVTTAKR